MTTPNDKLQTVSEDQLVQKVSPSDTTEPIDSCVQEVSESVSEISRDVALEQLKNEMMQIIQPKIDELEIKEDTPVSEIERMIWTIVRDIYEEHLEIRDNYAPEGPERNRGNAKDQVLYAIPAMVYMKAADVQEKDPARKAFYKIVFTQFLKFQEHKTGFCFDGTPQRQFELRNDELYNDVLNELKANCHEYVAFRKEARELLREYLQNEDSEVLESYGSLYDDATQKFNVEAHYPLITHVGHKEKGGKSEQEANHTAGTASHFHNQDLMRKMVDVPYPGLLYVMKKLAEPEFAEWDYEELTGPCARADGVHVGSYGKPGMKGSEIREEMKMKLEAYLSDE